MNRLSTSTLTVLTLLVLTLLPMPVLAQAPTDSVKDRIEIQEKLLNAYAYTCRCWRKSPLTAQTSRSAIRC